MVLHLVYQGVPSSALAWVGLGTLFDYVTGRNKRDASYEATKELAYAEGGRSCRISS